MDAVDYLEEQLRTRNLSESMPMLAKGGVVHLQESTDMRPLIALIELNTGEYRVLSCSVYANRAGQPQFSIYLKDFSEKSDAEDLFLRVWEGGGALAFGSEYLLSAGSGFRRINKFD